MHTSEIESKENQGSIFKARVYTERAFVLRKLSADLVQPPTNYKVKNKKRQIILAFFYFSIHQILFCGNNMPPALHPSPPKN